METILIVTWLFGGQVGMATTIIQPEISCKMEAADQISRLKKIARLSVGRSAGRLSKVRFTCKPLPLACPPGLPPSRKCPLPD